MSDAVQLGDVATWVGAVATLIALVFAAVAAKAARQVYAIESQRDQDAEAERRSRESEKRRSQAGKISAWCDLGGVDKTGRTIVGQYGLLVRNASELPVFDATVRYFWRPGGGVFTPLVRVDASSTHPDGHKSYPIDVLPPRERAVFLTVPREVFDAVHSDGRDQIVPELTFLDSEGVRWRRHPNGTLEELPVKGAWLVGN